MLAHYTQEKEYLNLRLAILSQAKTYSTKNNNFLEKLWLKRTKQGIANTTSNGFSEAEFKQNLDLLHELAITIKNGSNTHQNYQNAIDTLASWKKAGYIESIYKAQVARVFATFYPADFINWVTDPQIKNILKVFKEFNDLNLTQLKTSDDWHTISRAIRLSINNVNERASKSLNEEELRWLISQVYLQNSEYSNEKFDKQVKKHRKKYIRDLTNIPEGSLAPETIHCPGYDRKIRDPEVKAWVLANAKGKCEGCKLKAPFIDIDGFPFLEVHHMKHLANKGSDTIYNTVALCPNCHKKIHFGAEKDVLIEEIYTRVKRLKVEQ